MEKLNKYIEKYTDKYEYLVGVKFDTKEDLEQEIACICLEILDKMVSKGIRTPESQYVYHNISAIFKKLEEDKNFDYIRLSQYDIALNYYIDEYLSDKMDAELCFDIIRKHKNERQIRIFELRFKEDRTLQYIANEVGCSNISIEQSLHSCFRTVRMEYDKELYRRRNERIKKEIVK